MLIALALLTACRSSNGSHASVRIPGTTEENIRQAVVAVFQNNGYSLVSSLPEGMVFERPANGWDSFKWGGWGQGSKVVMRLRIKLEPIQTAYVVSCDVFYVRDPGNRILEDEQRLLFLDRRPYQKLLDGASRQVLVP